MESNESSSYFYEPNEPLIDLDDQFINDYTGWFNTLSNSINSLSMSECPQFPKLELHNTIEIHKFQYDQTEKNGLLEKATSIRIYYFYQTLVEKMLLVFKRNIIQLKQSANIEAIQRELNEFSNALNNLAKKCGKEIVFVTSEMNLEKGNCYQPITDQIKRQMNSFIFENFFKKNLAIEEFKEMSIQYDISAIRLQRLYNKKRKQIIHILRETDEIPSWIPPCFIDIVKQIKETQKKSSIESK